VVVVDKRLDRALAPFDASWGQSMEDMETEMRSSLLAQ